MDNQQTQHRVDADVDDLYCQPTCYERRRAPRINADVEGVVRSYGVRAPLACVVRDISETGARLQVERVDHFPDAFRLYLEQEDFSAACVVVWRSETEVGVNFESSPEM